MFEVFEHTADIGIRVRAAELHRVFEDAARGFFALIVANLDAVRPVQELHFEIQGDRQDDLLFDWLAELLFTFDTRHVLLSEFQVELTEDGLTAVARGEPIDRTRHELEMEVKAITYHQLKLQRDGDCWLAEVIVDI